MDEKKEKEKIPCHVAGEVAKEPEVSVVKSNRLVAKVLIAAKEVSVDGKALTGDELSRHKWQKLVLWGGDAKRAPSTFKPGYKVSVKGDLVRETWEGQDKVERVSYELHQPKSSRDEGQAWYEVTRQGKAVDFEGRVEHPPELQSTQTGNLFVRLSVDSPDVGQGNEKLRVLFWNDRAEEVEQNVRKGDSVHVKGDLVSRQYLDRFGEEKVAWEVLNPEMRVLDKQKDVNQGKASEDREHGARPDAGGAATDKAKEDPEPAKAFAEAKDEGEGRRGPGGKGEGKGRRGKEQSLSR